MPIHNVTDNFALKAFLLSNGYGLSINNCKHNYRYVIFSFRFFTSLCFVFVHTKFQPIVLVKKNLECPFFGFSITS